MLVDVSHTVEHGVVTSRGLPAPTVCDFRRYADGTDLASLPLEKLAVVVRWDTGAPTNTSRATPF